MSDDPEYGFPYIPLSRLRELKNYAEMVNIATQQGAFNGSDLWRVYVGLEVNQLMAEHWYGELDKARNYNPIMSYGCPLCVYENGVFIAHCGYHKIIDNLRVENSRLEHLVNDFSIKINEFYMGREIRIQRAKEAQDANAKADGSAGTESEGSGDGS